MQLCSSSTEAPTTVKPLLTVALQKSALVPELDLLAEYMHLSTNCRRSEEEVTNQDPFQSFTGSYWRVLHRMMTKTGFLAHLKNFLFQFRSKPPSAIVLLKPLKIAGKFQHFSES